MPYLPRNTTEIVRSLRAGIIGRTKVNDLNRGSALSLILSSFAEEIASIERRLFIFKESFSMNGAIGSDLDARVAQLPPVGISRITNTNASGAALRIERDPTDTSEVLVIPAGSTVSRRDGVEYRTTVEQVMGVGVSTLRNVPIVSLEPGKAGNASVGSITTASGMPSGIISVTNELALTNGTDRETDEQLRNRALTYLKSLSRCSPSSIEYLGTSFIGSNGERLTYARIYEDPALPGYAELVVDDGSGLISSAISKPGAAVTSVVTTGGQASVYHEAPATTPIAASMVSVSRAGSAVSISQDSFDSVPERGVLYFKPGVVQAGDVVSISGYRVYTGIISELQQEIEGDPSDFNRLTGFRAAGTRLAVKPVVPEFLQLDMALTAVSATDYPVVEQRVLTAISGYVNALSPGETLYISRLVELCVSVSGVRDVRFFKAGTTDAADNISPSSARGVLRYRSGSVSPSNV